MDKRTWSKIAFVGVLFAISIGGLQWWKYIHFGYNGLDLGIYSQTVWSLAHGHGFASSIHDPSYLGDHLELWLIPMSWLYRLWSSPLLLLWLQTLIIASALVPLTKLAYQMIGRRGAIIAAILFCLNPLIYNFSLYEFHGLIVALPLLMWSIWWYTEKRYWRWILSLIAIALVREDLPLLIAGWSVMAAIDRRSWRWWLPPLAIAAIWFPVAQTIIRAADHDGVYKYLAFYRWLGNTPGAMLAYPFHHPLLFLSTIVSFNNIGTVLGLLVTVGFLPLIRPRRLWPLLIIFGQLLLSSAQPGSFLRIHYTIPYIPFLVWASLSAWRDIQQRHIFQKFDRQLVMIITSVVVLIAPIYSSFIIGPIEWPWRGVQREATTPARLLQQALRDVQPDDRVLTSFAYLPALANRASLYSLNYLYLGRRQYSEIPYHLPSQIDVAIIDWHQLYEYQFLYRDTVFQGQSGLQRIQSLLSSEGLGIIQQYGSVTVYRRGGSLDTSSAQLSSADGRIQKLGPINHIGRPIVTQVNSPLSGWHEVLIENTWRAVSTKQDSPLSIRYTAMKNGHAVWQQPQVIGQGPQPASEWPLGTTWKTHDALMIPSGISGSITLQAEVFVPQGLYRLDRVRMFRPVINHSKTLGTFTLGSISLPPEN